MFNLITTASLSTQCATYFSGVDASFNNIFAAFCTPTGCPCADPGYAAPTGTVNSYSWTTTGTTYKSFFDCTDQVAEVSLGAAFDKIRPILEELEVELDCAGICAPADLWAFSDLDKHSGLPSKGCVEGIPDYVTSNLGLFAYLFTTIGCITYIANFIAYGLCCRKDDKKTAGKRGKKGGKNFSDDD